MRYSSKVFCQLASLRASFFALHNDGKRRIKIRMKMLLVSKHENKLRSISERKENRSSIVPALCTFFCLRIFLFVSVFYSLICCTDIHGEIGNKEVAFNNVLKGIRKRILTGCTLASLINKLACIPRNNLLSCCFGIFC